MGTRKKSAVVFCTYPKLVFAWPLLAIGPLFHFITPEVLSLEVAGWIYLMLMVLVVLTLSVDIERNHAAFWLLIFAVFFFLGRWLEDAKGFTFFGNIYDWFASLDVKYDKGFGNAISALLVVPYFVMLAWARLQHRWRITHNEFEHYSWGRADDSLARGAKRVRCTYPDLLEFLLLGAGTLIVYSATGRTELKRIPHVPLIFLVRKKINRLLESTMVTSEIMEHEEMAASEELGGDGGASDYDRDRL
ncbi:MAG: hypothetical protein CMJ19_10020 [Phycisphaeraceae bacterium]|nr:hypothetical protein [Phycisphaeraceae bacterium]